METDDIFIAIGISVLVWLLGYRALALGIFILSVIVIAISAVRPGRARVAAGGVSVQGAEMLEPIVIETVRQPPFRMPENMMLRVKPNWGAKLWREKAAGGAFANMAALLGKLLGFKGKNR